MRIPIELKVHYCGPPEVIRDGINKAKISVEVVYNDNSSRKLRDDEYIIYPNKEIKNIQKNYYVLQYTENQKTLKHDLVAYAVSNQEYENKELKVIQYVNGKGIDYTEDFASLLVDPLFGQIVFSFIRFAKYAWDGEYVITIPITKGVATRYASKWHVTIKNHNYKADIIECYTQKKEEEKNGQEE